MYEQIEKPKGDKRRSVANSVAQKKSNVKQGFGFVDNRPEALKQNEIQRMSDNYSEHQKKIVAPSIEPIIQRTTWSWLDGQWQAQDDEEPHTPAPNRDGTYNWETVNTANVQEDEAQETVEEDVGLLDAQKFNQFEWLFLLQNFLQFLNEVYEQNDPQPDGGHVAYKDQLQRPPTSGVKGSDHHTNTKGSGKKGRKVSSNQLKGDINMKIEEILFRLKLNSVPKFCKSPKDWDNWRDDHDPGKGGGGVAT